MVPSTRVRGGVAGWAGVGAGEAWSRTDLVPLLDQAGRPATFTHWYIEWLQKAELIAHQPSTNA